MAYFKKLLIGVDFTKGSHQKLTSPANLKKKIEWKEQ